MTKYLHTKVMEIHEEKHAALKYSSKLAHAIY